MKPRSSYLVCLNILLIISLTAYSENYRSPDWLRLYGGSGQDGIVDIAVGPDGNLYSVGFFSDTIDMDSTTAGNELIAKNQWDGLIFKNTSNGDLIWVKAISGVEMEYCTGIAIDKSGNLYIAGAMVDSTDFDPGTEVNIVTDAWSNFLLKLDSSGNFKWVKTIQVGEMLTKTSIALSDSGEIFITGSYYQTVDFDPSPAVFNLTSNGDQDVFIAKYDTTGQFKWAKSIGGDFMDWTYDICLDSERNIYAIGTFEGTADFDPGVGVHNLTSNGGQEVFILKLDPEGIFNWAEHFGGTSSDIGYGITTDSKNNLYATGAFQWTVDFDPGPQVHNLIGESVDAFVLKLSNSGDYKWAKRFGGTVNDIDQAYDVAIDPNDNIYITGNFNDTVDFDPDSEIFKIETKGNSDAFVVKLDSAGNFIWANSVGSENEDQGWVVCMDGTGNLYTAGAYSEIYYSTDTTEYEVSDFYIQKFSFCQVENSLTEEACKSFSLNGKNYNQSGTYFQHLNTTEGCDSLITLYLTINSINDSIIFDGSSLTAAEIEGSYQWINCLDNSIIENETGRSLYLFSFGDYAVIINKNECIDTANCYNYHDLSNEAIGKLETHNLYPNPSSGKFSIDFGTLEQISKISITDAQGRIIDSNSEFYTNRINVEINVPAGVYFMKIDSDNGLKTVKLIID